MITRDNIKDIVNQLSDRDKRRLVNTNKDYCVLYLSVFNTGSVTTMRLTNNYYKYSNVSDNGDCILDIDDVIQYLDR